MKNRVREFREKVKISQQELATAVGVSRQMISYIEKGLKRPNIIVALKIAKYFGKPVSTIFELDEND
ncbi:MAG: helix-turn-helix transcriptional regulator [Candidatus Lokiarchaeota archaeon]|nr:helix-turn-helix transcriptional regulator [Candidatus Harpocratesius repetitus]